MSQPNETVLSVDNNQVKKIISGAGLLLGLIKARLELRTFFWPWLPFFSLHRLSQMEKPPAGVESGQHSNTG